MMTTTAMADDDNEVVTTRRRVARRVVPCFGSQDNMAFQEGSGYTRPTEGGVLGDTDMIIAMLTASLCVSRS